MFPSHARAKTNADAGDAPVPSDNKRRSGDTWRLGVSKKHGIANKSGRR
jgi:hypothetical protein